MRVIGALLLLFGLVVLLWGGFRINREHDVMNVGNMRVTEHHQEMHYFPPIVGAVAAIGGVLLLVGDRRRIA